MKKIDLLFTAILVPLDFIMIILAGLSAYFIRFSSFSQKIRPVIFYLPFKNFLFILFWVAISWIIIFALSGLYSTKNRHKFIDDFYKIFTACSSGIILIFVIIFMRRELFDSRFIVLMGWFLSILFVFLGRLTIRIIKKKLFYKGIGVNNLIIIGNDKITKNIVDFFRKNKNFGYKILEWIKDDNDIEKKLLKIKKKHHIDEILYSGNIKKEKSIELINFSWEHHIDYKYIPNIFETQTININVLDLGGIPIIELNKTPLDGWKKIIKRIIDIIGSLIAIIIFSPIMLLIALAIKLDSEGPIFFGYQRIGQHGKPFFYFKFRSMIKNAHQMRYDENFRKKVQDLRGWNKENPMIKYKNDPRITRVGKFIRRTSLDELPEFFNVLIGKMSLVGPRPHEPEEVAKYKKEYKKLLTIKPGITGLSQISGRSDLIFQKEVRLDIYYIENWSLKLDLYILLKTPFAIFKKREAE